MVYNTLKEKLGVLPSLRLKKKSTVVTQSFVDDFDAQTLSDSTSPLPQILSDSNFPLSQTLSDSNSPLSQTLSSPHCYSSPKASFDSPSLIVFNTSSSSSSSLDDSLDGTSSLHTYRSSSVPPLLLPEGIKLLAEEEKENNTTGNNVSLPLPNGKVKIALHNNSGGKLLTNRCYKPLGSLTNYCMHPLAAGSHRTLLSEKRTISYDNNSQLIKRPRSANNLL